ncbi:MAG TPA: hypothetical protein VF283_23580 [Bryobacteraceae bacterium]
MSDFIVGIVVNVLSHIRIQHCKGSGIDRIATSAWNFAVWDSSEFVVLYPKVGFEDFDCSGKPEQCGIAFGEPAAFLSLTVLVVSEGERPTAKHRTG